MTRMRVDAMKVSGESQPTLSSTIGRCLSTLDTARKRIERKFELCFVMAKQSIPFAKYPVLLELEQRHEVDLDAGHAYNTADSARLYLVEASLAC